MGGAVEEKRRGMAITGMGRAAVGKSDQVSWRAAGQFVFSLPVSSPLFRLLAQPRHTLGVSLLARG